MRPNRPFLLCMAAIVAATGAQTQTRSLDAHEHGASNLDIAVEGNVVEIQLRAPGSDIVGFEHAAVSDADLVAVEAARTSLSEPLELFVLPDAAGCAVTAAEVEMVVGGEDEGDEGDDHTATEDNHNTNETMGEGHAEFVASYALTCADPSAIESIGFAYFDRFPGARELDVRLISDKGATGIEVTRDAPELDMRGLI